MLNTGSKDRSVRQRLHTFFSGAGAGCDLFDPGFKGNKPAI
jgi:hypothetical protein